MRNFGIICLLIPLFPALLAAQTDKSKMEAEKTAANLHFETVHITPKVKLTVSLSPTNARVGDTVEMTVKANIATGWHIQGLENGDDSIGGLPTKIRVRSRDIKPTDAVFAPSAVPDQVAVGDDKQLHHVEEISWTRSYVVKDSNIFVSGSIAFQACNQEKCLPPEKIKFRFGVPADERVSKPVSRKTNAKPIGEPVVVKLEDCDGQRDRVAKGVLDILLSEVKKEKLVYKAKVPLGDHEVDIYLPKTGQYKLHNRGWNDTFLANNSTYLSIDHNGDGKLDNHERCAANLPVRILDSMFQVTGINIQSKTMTLQQIDVPLTGSVLNRRCPEFEFTTVDGKTVSDKSILGKVTILDIWAVT